MLRYSCGVTHSHVKVEVAYAGEAKRGNSCESSPLILCLRSWLSCWFSKLFQSAYSNVYMYVYLQSCQGVYKFKLPVSVIALLHIFLLCNCNYNFWKQLVPWRSRMQGHTNTLLFPNTYFYRSWHDFNFPMIWEEWGEICRSYSNHLVLCSC